MPNSRGHRHLRGHERLLRPLALAARLASARTVQQIATHRAVEDSNRKTG
jgi:hypothetical protein